MTLDSVPDLRNKSWPYIRNLDLFIKNMLKLPILVKIIFLSFQTYKPYDAIHKIDNFNGYSQ